MQDVVGGSEIIDQSCFSERDARAPVELYLPGAIEMSLLFVRRGSRFDREIARSGDDVSRARIGKQQKYFVAGVTLA